MFRARASAHDAHPRFLPGPRFRCTRKFQRGRRPPPPRIPGGPTPSRQLHRRSVCTPAASESCPGVSRSDGCILARPRQRADIRVPGTRPCDPVAVDMDMLWRRTTPLWCAPPSESLYRGDRGPHRGVRGAGAAAPRGAPGGPCWQPARTVQPRLRSKVWLRLPRGPRRGVLREAWGPPGATQGRRGAVVERGLGDGLGGGGRAHVARARPGRGRPRRGAGRVLPRQRRARAAGAARVRAGPRGRHAAGGSGRGRRAGRRGVQRGGSKRPCPRHSVRPRRCNLFAGGMLARCGAPARQVPQKDGGPGLQSWFLAMLHFFFSHAQRGVGGGGKASQKHPWIFGNR
ncbi:unnamed protein product, partial [Prorocentrum cordatum]